MLPAIDICERAVASRDARFDGWFTTGVTTTGIYCRPSCPSRTPRTGNMRFFASPAAALGAGFRACKRCRPDAAPGSPEWNVRTDVAARAMRLIADGTVDRDGVPALASRLGYSVRQLERLLTAELGAGPLALARAQRAQTARILLETTELPITDVAFAAGYASVRAFGEGIHEHFALSPSALRGGRGTGEPGRIALRLAYRQPLEPGNLFGHLIATGVPGVEEFADGAYRAAIALPHGLGIVALRPPVGDAVDAVLQLDDLRDLPAAIARCRWALDLDADPTAIDAALGEDPALAPLTAATPGRRVPRTLDPSGFAIRAVLGQQISTAAARTHAARLADALGTPVPDGTLSRVFPTPAQLAADPDLVREVTHMPDSRRRTVLAVAEALADGRVRLDPGADRAEARASLLALPGVGPWTVETVAMRALGDPDAFPSTDLGVLYGADSIGIPRPEIARRAATWAPWRAYAVQHLWATGTHAVNSIPAVDAAPAPKKGTL
jgi:AraC family transcriptional regulator, regulatory protein of adaptative response / DNA-3-methyladenine glycosylase II